MRIPRLRRGQAVAIVSGVGVVACLVAGLARPTTDAVPTATVLPLATAVLVCPHPEASASASSTLGLVAPPAADPSTGSVGRATLTAMSGSTDPVVDLDAAGSTGSVSVLKGKTVPYVAHGEGALAPGLAGGQVTSITTGRNRGLLATTCAAPSGDAWFVGGGGSVGRRTTLLLTNSDSTPALVDIQVFGPDGPVPARGGQGVLVPPRKQRAVRLDVLVPGTTRTALHVVTRAGRVSAAVQDIDTVGLIPRGSDYVPQSQPPATRVVVPGILGGSSGTRFLQVVAPGDADAIVNLHVVADDGTFAPESSAVLEIAAGSVDQVDLAPMLKGIKAAAVLLESDTPVVAGVRTVLPLSGGRAEQTYTAGTPALTGPAAFGPVTIDGSHRASLLLTAADADGVVTLTILDPAGGAPTTRELLVPGGTSQRVDLTDPLTGAAVVLAPAEQSGPVEAVLLLFAPRSDGTMVAGVPLVPGRTTVTVPPVQPDPATGVPGH